MKVETKNNLLKLAYIVALGLLYNSAAIIVKSLFLSGLTTIFDLVSVVLCVCAGQGVAIAHVKPRLRGALYVVTGLAVGLAGFLAYRSYSDQRIAIEILLMLTCFYAGIKAGKRSYIEITGLKWAMPAIVVVILGMVLPAVLKIEDNTAFRPVAFFYIYIFAALSLVLENQKNIDYLLTDMERQTPKLPVYIRRFNLIVVTATTLLISLFAFTGPLVKAVRFILRELGSAVNAVLGKFFSLLFSGGDKSEPTVPRIPEPEMPGKVRPRFKPGLDEKIVFGILAVLGTIIFIFLLTKLPFVFRELKRSLRRLFAVIRARLSFVSPRSGIVTKVFSDEVEFTKDFHVEEVMGDESAPRKKRRNSLRDDPVAQVRYYYGLILDMLCMAGLKITKSDTAGQIHGKALNLDGVGGPLSEMTEIYNRVRYGDEIPAAETVEKAKESCSLINAAIKASDRKKEAGQRKKKPALKFLRHS